MVDFWRIVFLPGGENAKTGAVVFSTDARVETRKLIWATHQRNENVSRISTSNQVQTFPFSQLRSAGLAQ